MTARERKPTMSSKRNRDDASQRDRTMRMVGGVLQEEDSALGQRGVELDIVAGLDLDAEVLHLEVPH